ncbi:MAG: hypothetical protein HY909_08610 [Deltaproteobacteria bacterium]|nr:hypothetical protein [Deltaproteobacteria bacterium]
MARKGSSGLSLVWFVLAVGGALAAGAHGCTQPRPRVITQRFEDAFERTTLGPDWRETGSGWRIENGSLRGENVRNHPLWLTRRLPRDARIEFDAWSDSPAGDLKCEVWGDGQSFAQQASYTATSYVVIFGGWGNRYNVLARMDEHAPDRRQRVGPRVSLGRRYHFQVERQGRRLQWLLDGNPMLEWDDPDPLAGPGHEYFAFNDWEALVHFDNLVITPL